MNSFLKGLKEDTNYTYTENGAITHKTTQSALLDMFGMGGAYRNRSDEDCIMLFRNAFAENPIYALKCLFYLRDIRGGQGERRFFRVCMKDLATTTPKVAARNLKYIPEFGRWDDLYLFVGTPLEKNAFDFMKEQLVLDVQCETPSLLAKWLKSENTSSTESRALGNKTREYFGMTHKQYRKTLSILRTKINVLETLMSAGKWDQIEFDKIPSKAGLIYRNAFAVHDIERAAAGKMSYEDFITDENTILNAKDLNPVDIAKNILNDCWGYDKELSGIEVAALQKYWDNLKDYYNGREENGIAIVDTSGSMWGTPMAAAVSMGAYIAERGHGPFANHFITFSSDPDLVKFEGVNIVDKIRRAKNANWGMSTNIEKAFNLLLNSALEHDIPQKDMPETLYIFSDMEFDGCIENCYSYNNRESGTKLVDTLLESIEKKWKANGYEMPRVIFWNLNARQNNIPALGGRFSYISGFSMNMIEAVLSGKDGYDLMMEKLDSERYSVIQ